MESIRALFVTEFVIQTADILIFYIYTQILYCKSMYNCSYLTIAPPAKYPHILTYSTS